uniref:Putative c2h2-type zn-finger protein n=1 Tax=Ixodes ricinus TaxID=34613 RepID=A0A147BEY9_IXORI
MILPCDVSSHVSTSVSSSSMHPCAMPSSLTVSPPPLFSMDPSHQSPEQLMAQYAAHVLRQHHQQQQQQQAKPYSRRTPAAKPYSCEQCGRGFKYLHTLRFHIKTTHDSAAPAVEPRLSRLRRDAPPASDVGFGSADRSDLADAREEDLSVHRGPEGPRPEPDGHPEFPQDVSPQRPAAPERDLATASIKKEAVEHQDASYGTAAKLEDAASRMGGLARMGSMPSPPPLLGVGVDSWRGVKLQSEVPLAIKVDAVNPLTEQQYTLYKCGVCGETHPALRALCDHLEGHVRAAKEHHCDKCGAVFKWRSQLLVHEQVHQVIEGKGAGLSLPPGSLLGTLPDALIGEPRVSFDQALQLQLAGQQLLPGFLQHGALPNLAMGLPPLSLAGTTSSAGHPPSPSLADFSSGPATTSSRGNGSTKSAGGSLSTQEGGAGGARLPFQCSYCSKSFDRIFSLQRHERIHTGVKPCYCKACGRGFSERRNLRHHIIRFHSDVSQRDQLRRRRRAAAARSRVAATAASANCAGAGAHSDGASAASGTGGATPPAPSSLKLVSFLKKTAVRILNSMEQTKGGEEGEERHAEEEEEEEDEEEDMMDREERAYLSNGGKGSGDAMEEDEDAAMECNEERSGRLDDSTAVLGTRGLDGPVTKREGRREEEEAEEDNKTIIYPLDVSSAQVEDRKSCEDAQSLALSSSQECDGAGEARKPAVVTGNRRKKGKPMRYGPAVVEEAAEDCAADKGSEDAPDEDATTEEGDGSRGEADEALNPYSKEEMATWMQLGKQLGNNASSCENGDANSPEASTKAPLQGQGPFYPSFNPRPDSEERQSNDEAGKPQLGPDGKCVYSCSYCYKSFSSTSDLSRHMDLHEGERRVPSPLLCRSVKSILRHAARACTSFRPTPFTFESPATENF